MGSNTRGAARKSAVTVAAGGVMLSLFAGVAAAAAPADFQTWARTARIAGAPVWSDMTAAEMNTLVTDMAKQNVSVIEADSNLSNYLDDSAFSGELAAMRSFADASHAQGLKVGWYYPTLEVLTPNGQNIAQTMAKEHPDWVQRGLDGSPNVFYGGLVFWVEDGAESAWMSPSSTGYREYFRNRVKQIAATGLDYLWGDVPLLNDIGTAWADTNPASQAAFTAATGMTAPTTLDWNDPVWRRWVAWRHQEIKDFLADVAAAARSVNPDFKFMVETVTMDYGATKIGLDGADLKDIPGVAPVWELDAVSDSDAMSIAKEDDWVRLIAMNKHARGAAGAKPSWIFTYGLKADDAELVMAESIAAGNSPYETKIPLMATSVGAAYRSKMFGWMKANSAVLDETRPAARIALVYSPPSHDFVDKAAGQGLYATTTSTAKEFWSEDAADSVYQRQYLAEYTGLVKLLVNQHVPFDVLVRPTAQELAAYQTVVLPDLEAVADDEAALLRSYTNAGGHLIATGTNPTGWDQYGSTRTQYALADVLGVTKAAALPATRTQRFGAGEARLIADLPGRKYLTSASDATAATAKFMSAVNDLTTSWLTTDADRRVHFELRESADGQRLMLHQVNSIGMDGSFTVVPASHTTTIHVPAGQEVTGVEVTSPDNATQTSTALAYTTAGQDVTFTTPVNEYAVVVVSLRQTAPPVNRIPVAGDDDLATTAGTPVAFTADQLLANDSDADGDRLSVASVSAASQQGGAVAGSYLYTPKAGFVGRDSFSYTISDGRGGSADGRVSVQVAAAPENPSPQPSASVEPSTVPGPQPGPASPQPTAAQTTPAASVAVRATAGRSKLHVDVNPNVGKRYWKFKVQRQRADGSWAERKTTYRTAGPAETSTINLPKGTYWVRVLDRYGFAQTISTPVTLRR